MKVFVKRGAVTPALMEHRSAPAQKASPATRYSRGAMVLHWLLAALVLAQIALGLYGASGAEEKNDAAQSAIQLHKTLGILILLLTVVRIGWRLGHKPPPLPESMARVHRRLVGCAHALFYVLLVVLPLAGWWLSSAVPDPRRHAFGLGLFDIPFLPVPRGWASAGVAHFVHTNLAWVMIALVGLHIGGVLKQHFVDKNDILKRMLPLTHHC